MKADSLNANALPTDERSERALIATLIAAPKLLHEVLPVIETDEVLVHPAYRLLLQIIRAIHLEGKPLKMMTVLQRLTEAQTQQLQDADVSLITLSSEAREVDCLETAHHLKALFIKRQVVEAAATIIRSVEQGETTQHIVDLLSKAATAASQGRAADGHKTLSSILAESLAKIERALSGKQGLTGVPTGLAKLDRHFGGWQGTDVVMIAGRPGMGKSLVGLAHAEAAARQGVPVAYLSLEMAATAMANRLYSACSNIPYGEIKKGRIDMTQFALLHKKMGELSGLPIHFYDEPNRDVNDLSAKLLYWKQKYGIGLVIIDYVQLLEDRTVKSKEEYSVLTSVSKKLKQLQLRLGCPLIELAQLNRSVEGRGGSKRGRMSDLRSTGQFEQDASVIIMLYREDYYREEAEKEAAEAENRPFCEPFMSHELEYGIVKNRDGFTGTVTLYCDVTTNVLLDSAPAQLS